MDCEYFTGLSLPNSYLGTVSSDMYDEYRGNYYVIFVGNYTGCLNKIYETCRDKYLVIFVMPAVQGEFSGVFLYVLRRRIKVMSVSLKRCVQSPGAYVEI